MQTTSSPSPNGATHVSLLTNQHYQRTDAKVCNYWSFHQNQWLPCYGVSNEALNSAPFQHVLVLYITDDAEWMKRSNITVEVNRSMEFVTISKFGEDDIFWQGHETHDFIRKCDELYDEVQTLGMDVIELHLAKQYAENIW